MEPLFLQGSMGILYSHVQDIVAMQARECDKVSILILSIPFRSIHLSYCFRKLDSYSVQLHDTIIVLPKFEGIDSMSTYWLVIFGTNENGKHHAKQF